MTSFITTILSTFILTLTTVYGQTYEPLDLVKKIFSQDGLPNIENYITAEYHESPNVQDLPVGSTTQFTLLGQTETTAVVAMTILDTLGEGFDAYFHFEKDTIWKISAFRGLAMTGFIEQLKTELEKMTPEQVNEMIKSSKKNKKGKEHVLFTSKEEYEFELGNAKLILELDDNIANHFLSNQAEFERLKNRALTQLEKETPDEERSIKLIENFKTDYRKIFISSVSTGGYQLGNCINFLIGGMIDNTVGYLYVTDKKYLPEMSPERVIMIKEIANGWYIYKTT